MSINIFIKSMTICVLILALSIDTQRHKVSATTSLESEGGLNIAEPSSRQNYEGYYLHLGDHPAEENPGWDTEAQGLAHDQDHWFITQDCCLWRIPVAKDLSTVQATDAGVTRIELSRVSQLAGYNHLGDLTYHEFEGKGYVIVPVEAPNHSNPCSVVALFDSNTLAYIDSQCLPGQTDGSWVAVDPSGVLYSSDNNVTGFRRYTVDWNNVKTNGKLTIAVTNNFDLFDEAGTPLTLSKLQGGEVSPSGELIFAMASDGINVFDIATHRRVQRSTNGSGYFNYEFHPGCCKYEEAEGITLWDLDDDRAPGIRGQLHAIMLDNDAFNTDDVYIKHYTNKIAVDVASSNGGNGTREHPFKTLADANNLAWDGAILSLQPGSYSEKITLSKRVKLVAPAGSVQIGK